MMIKLKIPLWGMWNVFGFFGTNSNQLLPFLLLCGSLTACKKEGEIPEALPPVSSMGANTFGAIVNGKIVTATGAENFSGGLYADEAEDSCRYCWLPPDSSDLFLRISHKDFPMSYLFLTDPKCTSEWKLNQSSMAFWESNKLKTYVEIDQKRSGFTTDGSLKSDYYKREDRIFSAVFSFHCINPKTCQEYSVTDGRIDVNLNSISYLP